MNFIIALFFVLSFNSFADSNFESLQKETLEMVHDFQRNYHKYLKRQSPSISVRMVGEKELLFEDSVASCTSSPKVLVLVKKEIWEEASKEKREYILFRQLGRCVLNRYRYVNEEIRNIPLSIITQRSNKQSHYQKYREEYIKELFDRDTLSFIEKIVND